jgi:hypothetical protein
MPSVRSVIRVVIVLFLSCMAFAGTHEKVLYSFRPMGVIQLHASSPTPTKISTVSPPQAAHSETDACLN